MDTALGKLRSNLRAERPDGAKAVVAVDFVKAYRLNVMTLIAIAPSLPVDLENLALTS